MFILDTHVVSELRNAKAGRADGNVTAWAAGQPPAALFLSVVTVLELDLGVLQVERRDPRQGAVLRTWLEQHVLSAFAGRLLPIDTAVVQRCAMLQVPDPRSERDALIAATALVHGMTLVTRNVADFERTGVPVLDPWGVGQVTASHLAPREGEPSGAPVPHAVSSSIAQAQDDASDDASDA